MTDFMSKAHKLWFQQQAAAVVTLMDWVSGDDPRRGRHTSRQAVLDALRQAYERGLEDAAKLIEAGQFDASVRLDVTRHKSVSEWFREQQAAAIRKLKEVE